MRRISKMRLNVLILIAIVIAMTMVSNSSEGAVNKWTVIVTPPIAFLNETTIINISGGTPYTAFLFEIKRMVDTNLTLVESHTYSLGANGTAILNYTGDVEGTYFFYFTDGATLFADPISFVVMRNETNQTVTRDDLQEKAIQQMQAELSFQAELLAKEREWDFINVALLMVLLGVVILDLMYDWHHLIHEHPTYWNHQTPSKVMRYAVMGKKQYQNNKQGIWEWGRGFYTKWLTITFASNPGEVDGFQQEFHNPSMLEELQMHDLSDIVKGISIRNRKVYRIWKTGFGYPNFRFKCLNCGNPYDAFGPKSKCPFCTATADFVPPSGHTTTGIFAGDEEIADRLESEGGVY